METADFVGQLRWKHGDGPVGKVNACPPLVGLFVEGALLSHVVTDVGDRNIEPLAPVPLRLDRDRVIEVPCILAIDRKGGKRPQVYAIGPVLRWRGRWKLLRLPRGR